MKDDDNSSARESTLLRERNVELEKRVKDLEKETSRQAISIKNYSRIVHQQGKLIILKDEQIQNHAFDYMLRHLELFESTDPYTEGHSLRVTKFAIMIAKAMGLPEDQIDELHRGGHMHDIGKVRWNEEDFRKTHLTEKDKEKVRQHPVTGAKYLETLARNHKEYQGLAPIARHHHEHYGGISIKTHPDAKYPGYPGELIGDAIPLPARIVAVGDSFDAMTTDRAYKHKRTIEKAFEESKRCCGMPYDEELIPNEEPDMQFDPEIIEAFLSIKTVGSSKSRIVHRIGCQDLLEIDSLDIVVNPTGYTPCVCIENPPKFVMYKPAA